MTKSRTCDVFIIGGGSAGLRMPEAFIERIRLVRLITYFEEYIILKLMARWKDATRHSNQKYNILILSRNS